MLTLTINRRYGQNHNKIEGDDKNKKNKLSTVSIDEICVKLEYEKKMVTVKIKTN